MSWEMRPASSSAVQKRGSSTEYRATICGKGSFGSDGSPIGQSIDDKTTRTAAGFVVAVGVVAVGVAVFLDKGDEKRISCWEKRWGEEVLRFLRRKS